MNTATTDTPRMCARCGHSEHTHGNAGDPKLRKPNSKRPCHHRGKHDRRCECRDFQPSNNTPD